MSSSRFAPTLLAAACLWLALAPCVLADEGMWLPEQLPELAPILAERGLEVPASTLADLEAHPMSAVVSLGGCSASFVSPRGLVVTNHHCAYGALQLNSTDGTNLIEEGFLAAERSDEIPAGPGSRIWVTAGVEDVTAEITRGLGDLAGKERYDAVEERRKALVARCEETQDEKTRGEEARSEETSAARCRVASYYGGHRYELIRRLEIRDVRIVYAPKGAVGTYGGDADNWMWPRHTGDFAFYRAYVGPDGRPADPAPENVPYEPPSHLELNPAGVAAGDFVMVLGYPGFTSRHRLATEVEHTFEWSYPFRIQELGEALEIIEEATEGRPDAAIRYASMIAGINNFSKKMQGMLEGYDRSQMLPNKRLLELGLQEWIDADPARSERWGDVLAELRAVIEEGQVDDLEAARLRGATTSSLYGHARLVYRLAKEREKPDAERESGYQERDLPMLKARLERADRRYDETVDRALWRDGIVEYAELEPGLRQPEMDAWLGLAPDENALVDEELDAFLDRQYRGSRLDELDFRLEMMNATPEKIEASDDPFLQAAVALYPMHLRLEEESEERTGSLQALRPRYMEALLAYLDARDRPVYPDANSTLRVTFGTVRGYEPRDGVAYLPFTTAEGLLEKETGQDPFASPQELLQAVRGGEFGPYDAGDRLVGSEAGEAKASPAQRTEQMPVNFLADLDITGGNSGSATLDARGRLVGLAFDGNWESIISDWDFLPEVTRTIHVDVRYMLWIMDRIDGAHALLREMGVEPALAPDASPPLWKSP